MRSRAFAFLTCCLFLCGCYSFHADIDVRADQSWTASTRFIVYSETMMNSTDAFKFINEFDANLRAFQAQHPQISVKAVAIDVPQEHPGREITYTGKSWDELAAVINFSLSKIAAQQRAATVTASTDNSSVRFEFFIPYQGMPAEEVSLTIRGEQIISSNGAENPVDHSVTWRNCKGMARAEVRPLPAPALSIAQFSGNSRFVILLLVIAGVVGVLYYRNRQRQLPAQMWTSACPPLTRSPLPADMPALPATAQFCPHCGKSLATPGAGFCGECGRKL